MKGIIVVNPFLQPQEAISQAKRMQQEFKLLNVQTEIINNGYLSYRVNYENIEFDLSDVDFAVFFDKDKYFARALEKAGVRVFNCAKAIRDCDDKGETYIELCSNNIKMPKTIFAPLCYLEDACIEYSSAVSIANKLNFPIIVKESFGSMGKGVYLASNTDELYELMKKLKNKPHLFQEYLGYKKGTDIRIIVIGYKVIACMQRYNANDFRSNIAKGGKGFNITPPAEFTEMAIKCAKALNLDYCGVDLLYDNDGQPVVCEVNSNAFFKGIESVTNVNVAKAYATYIIQTLKK